MSRESERASASAQAQALTAYLSRPGRDIQSLPIFETQTRPRTDSVALPPRSEKILHLSISMLFAEIMKESESANVEWVEITESPHTVCRNAKGEITAATVDYLVQVMTSPLTTDLDLIDTFLGTFRSFVSVTQLFLLLLRRFYGCLASSIDDRSVSRLQTHFVLRRWINQYPTDFDNNPTLYRYTNSLIDRLKQCHFDNLSLQLEASLKKSQSRFHSHVIVNAPPPKFPPLCTASWLDVDDQEIARQLTLMEAEIFSRMERSEFLSCAWSKPSLKAFAPNVLESVHRFNLLSMFLVSEIVKTESLQRRKVVLEKVLNIMTHLLALNNFNTLMSFSAACLLTPVYRLKQTWALMPKKLLAEYQKILKILSSDSNFKILRAEFAQRQSPKLPYLGMHMSDLVFLSDGSPDVMPGTEMINFDKRRKEHAVIQSILKEQKMCYNLHPVPRIQELLRDLSAIDERDAFSRSLRIEPRQQ